MFKINPVWATRELFKLLPPTLYYTLFTFGMISILNVVLVLLIAVLGFGELMLLINLGFISAIIIGCLHYQDARYQGVNKGIWQTISQDINLIAIFRHFVFVILFLLVLCIVSSPLFLVLIEHVDLPNRPAQSSGGSAVGLILLVVSLFTVFIVIRMLLAQPHIFLQGKGIRESYRFVRPFLKDNRLSFIIALFVVTLLLIAPVFGIVIFGLSFLHDMGILVNRVYGLVELLLVYWAIIWAFVVVNSLGYIYYKNIDCNIEGAPVEAAQSKVSINVNDKEERVLVETVEARTVANAADTEDQSLVQTTQSRISKNVDVNTKVNPFWAMKEVLKLFPAMLWYFILVGGGIIIIELTLIMYMSSSYNGKGYTTVITFGFFFGAGVIYMNNIYENGKMSVSSAFSSFFEEKLFLKAMIVGVIMIVAGILVIFASFVITEPYWKSSIRLVIIITFIFCIMLFTRTLIVLCHRMLNPDAKLFASFLYTRRIMKGNRLSLLVTHIVSVLFLIAVSKLGVWTLRLESLSGYNFEELPQLIALVFVFIIYLLMSLFYFPIAFVYYKKVLKIEKEWQEATFKEEVLRNV